MNAKCPKWWLIPDPLLQSKGGQGHQTSLFCLLCCDQLRLGKMQCLAVDSIITLTEILFTITALYFMFFIIYYRTLRAI